MTPDNALDLAEDYLERERQILLSGQIGELERLQPTREKVVSALLHTKGEARRVKRLRVLAQRNRVLLKASAEGVQRAIKRLGELRKAAGPIQSYSSNGGQCAIGPVNPQFERKA
ncbi:MAG: hypothetical protein AAF566_02495 [Pseudomonadota bacterium]